METDHHQQQQQHQQEQQGSHHDTPHQNKELDELHKKHEGHEELHSTILLSIMLMSMIAQIVIVVWKSRSPQTFLTVSMFGLWLFPILYNIYIQDLKSIVLWCAFTMVIFVLYRKSTSQPLDRNTPKIVYMSFYIIYIISIGITFLGVIGMFSEAYNLYLPLLRANYGYILFYGLYYGVIGRDFAELCSNKIANILGIGGSRLPTTKLSNNYCAICTGNLDSNKHGTVSTMMESTASLSDSLNENKQKSSVLDKIMNFLFSKKSCKLACGHCFHLYCIRGWALVGKNNVCPNCNEKVDIKSFCDNPWEQTSLLWGFLLDVIRYLVAWNPIIIIASRFIIFVFDR